MYASDGTTLAEVVQGFEERGFRAQMVPRPDGRVRCGNCHREADAQAFHLEALRRTEGASDPADMVAVVALRCPNCDAGGTAALKYGPDASDEETDVLRRVEDDRPRDGSGAQA